MLSDEEKKAIEKIKKIVYMFPESEELKLLLNLIEKQSKEIEELYQDNLTLIQEINKKWKDKIKAKIEEYKWAVESYDCDEADYKQSQAIGAWNVLQSLLEKE